MKVLDVIFSTPSKPHVHKCLFDIFSSCEENAKIRSSMYMWGNGTKKELEKKLYYSPRKLNQIIERTAEITDFRICLDGFNTIANKTYMDHLKEHIGDKIHILNNQTKESDPYYRNELIFKNKKRTEGYLHSKFFTFSKIPHYGENIVLITSANINFTQYYQYNDMTIMQGKETYDWFNHYFDYLIDKNIDLKRTDGIYVFPDGKCPIEKEIDYLIKNNIKSKISILMSFFTKTSLRNKLIDAKKNGCEIEVVVSKEPISTKCLWECKKYGIKIRRTKNNDWEGRMHHKIVMISNENGNIVFNGSYNATMAALSLNDDFSIRFEDNEYYMKCLNQFEYIKSKTKCL